MEPSDVEHPIGNTLGEFQRFGDGAYQHSGIDILAEPMFQQDYTSENLLAPWVIATVGGQVVEIVNQEHSKGNYVSVEDLNGQIYRYAHLEYNSIPSDIHDSLNNSSQIVAGSRVGKIVNFHYDFDHLHYEVRKGDEFVGPMASIFPNPDAEAPEISLIGFALDNTDPWDVLVPSAPGACTVVSGQVDIIGKIRDQDNAGLNVVGAVTQWVYNIQWRACPDSDPDCDWQSTYTFDRIPASWVDPGNQYSAAQFSSRNPWVSDSNYGLATWIFGLVTNWIDGTPSLTGNWDTNGGNGSYSISLRATDFAGNTTNRGVRACVQNDGNCVTELTIRDAEDDTGAIPYWGGSPWHSPDIIVNPGAADENQNVRLGESNLIRVQAWNFGSCPFPEDSDYEVCLAWGLPSTALPFPVAASQLIGCKTENSADANWDPGFNRTIDFFWTPDAVSVPGGHHCLTAWIQTQSDPVHSEAPVTWDDNRAQRNISFVEAPAEGPYYLSFWLNPIEHVASRNLEIETFSGREWRVIERLRLHLPEVLKPESVAGGMLIGGYEGTAPSDPCIDRRILGDVMCGSSEGSTNRELMLVVDGAGSEGLILLESVQVIEPTQIGVEVQFVRPLESEEFYDLRVSDYGHFAGQDEVRALGGLTLRFANLKSSEAR